MHVSNDTALPDWDWGAGKSTLFISTAVAITIIFFAILELNNVPIPGGNYFKLHAPNVPILLGTILLTICLVTFAVMKHLHTERHPDECFKAFLRRDWQKLL